MVSSVRAGQSLTDPAAVLATLLAPENLPDPGQQLARLPALPPLEVSGALRRGDEVACTDFLKAACGLMLGIGLTTGPLYPDLMALFLQLPTTTATSGKLAPAIRCPAQRPAPQLPALARALLSIAPAIGLKFGGGASAKASLLNGSSTGSIGPAVACVEPSRARQSTMWRGRGAAMRPIEALVETAIYADDLELAERFYRDVLGLDLTAREEGRHVFFRVGDRSMLLVFRAESTLKGDHLPAHGCRGPGHLALGIPAQDLDAWRSDLESRHVSIEHEESWPRGGHSLYFRDPAGNSVELLTPGLWGLPSGW